MAPLVGGLLLLALGIVFLAEELGLADLGWAFERLWPLLIVALGVSKLLDPGKRRGGIWITALGLWLLVGTLELWNLDIGDSWPLLLVFAGFGIVLDALLGKPGAEPTTSPRTRRGPSHQSPAAREEIDDA